MPRVTAPVYPRVLASYFEKIFVVFVAVAALSGLYQLGQLNELEKKQPISKDLLEKLAIKAGEIAHDEERKGVAQPLQAIADNFRASKNPTERLTPQELTTQIEHV